MVDLYTGQSGRCHVSDDLIADNGSSTAGEWMREGRDTSGSVDQAKGDENIHVSLPDVVLAP